MMRSSRSRRDGDRERLSRADLPQLARMLSLARPYRRHLVLATIGVVVASLLGLVYPRILGELVDTALAAANGSATTSLDRFAIVLVVVFFAQAAFGFLRIYYLASMGEGVVADLRREVYAHLMTLPVAFFDSRRTGELMSRITSDVAVVQATLSNSMAAALAQGITLIGGIVLIFVISPTLAMSVLLFVPIVIIAAAFFGRGLRRISTEFQDRVADANAAAEESFSAARVVKWFGAENERRRRYSDAVDESYRVALRRARLRALFIPGVTFVGFATLAFVLWRGGRLVLDGALDAGELVSFLLYTLIVAGAIGTFTGLYGQLQEALGASRRIFELLDERSDIVDTEAPEPYEEAAGRIELRQVGFSYPDRDVPVLEDVSFIAEPGEVVALVGPSGAGKSSLVQLLPRFYDVASGVVLVDGHDVRDVGVDELRRHMAAVPQETQLFSDTIAENLRVGRPEATDAELVEAAKAANAHRFIVEFPDGYETLVGERGIKLSGGQRQRVAIARALLKDPRILVLDEATSSLDSESEALVQEALRHLMTGRTTVVIAHRLSTVQLATQLIVLDQGRVVETGTHEELLTANGLYAELYRLQRREAETPQS